MGVRKEFKKLFNHCKKIKTYIIAKYHHLHYSDTKMPWKKKQNLGFFYISFQISIRRMFGCM